MKNLVNDASIILIFSSPTVDPAFVTKALCTEPTHAVAVGETDHYSWNNQAYISSVGLWKLVIKEFEEFLSMEERLSAWLTWLENKKENLSVLGKAGYTPYLLFAAAAIKENLAVWLEPETLTRLSDLDVSLCIDVNERPMQEINGE
jgi:hypothetical protein